MLSILSKLRAQAELGGHAGATTAYPGFVPAFIRDSFCEGRGPFRWVALSGNPADIAATDRARQTLNIPLISMLTRNETPMISQ